MRCRSLTAITLMMILSWAVVAQAGSKMTITGNEFDFGYAPYDVRISHDFWLHSTGDDTLIIKKIIPGCGCTKAPLEKNVIAPGDSSRLEIIFNTNKYKGKVMKTPRIISNTGAKEEMVIILTNVIKEPESGYPLDIRPYILNVPEAQAAAANRLTFAFTNKSDKDLSLSLISYPQDYIDVQLPKTVKAGKTAEGTVTIKKDVTPDFEKSFTIALNDKDKSRITIPVVRESKTDLSMKNK